MKSGGRVYLSRDSNRPVVSSHAADVKKNAGKQLLIIGCRLWNNVSTEVRYVAAPRTVPDRVICRGRPCYWVELFTPLVAPPCYCCGDPETNSRPEATVRKTYSHTANVGQSSAVSPLVTEVINPAVGCHYFPPGPRLPPQPPSITARWPVPNYTAW